MPSVHFNSVSISNLALIALACVTACGRDAAPHAGARVPPAGTTLSQSDFRQQQQRTADSLINAAQTANQIVNRLGTGYLVGSVRMRDSLHVLTDKSHCFAQGRAIDPYLAGTVNWSVFMSVIGSTIVRVEQAQWTSLAGNVVTSCLNIAAKDWQFASSFGKPGTHVTQLQFKPLAVTASK